MTNSQKVLAYSGFTIAAVVVVAIFLAARSYTHLALGTIFYIPVALFAFKMFVKRNWKTSVATASPSPPPSPSAPPPAEELKTSERGGVEVVDLNKRAFLKLIGATGASFFLFSLFGRRAEALLWPQQTVATPTSAGQPNPTDDYRVSEIDEGDIYTYYGFIKRDGIWLIMRSEAGTGSFRYARGDSNFQASWIRRKQLGYDYFHALR